MSIEEYADLASTGYQGGSSGDKIAPEDEFYHSVYIAGSTRKNHINVKELAGQYQVRGVEYNLDEVHMIITHTKEILVHNEKVKGRDSTKCFSYKGTAPPWFGTTKLGDGSARQCPQTSAERAVNDFCSPCRSQIIVAGLYCKEDGAPILTEDNKPIFIFIRARGMKYSNVSNYLNDLYNIEDLIPIFEATPENQEFEKRIVNNKRFVTKLTMDTQKSSYGNDVNIFVLDRGTALSKETVLNILKASKKTVEQFNEKFDWSQRKQTSDYGQTEVAKEAGMLPMEENKKTEESETNTEEKAKEAGVQSKPFSFDDINF